MTKGSTPSKGLGWQRTSKYGGVVTSHGFVRRTFVDVSRASLIHMVHLKIRIVNLGKGLRRVCSIYAWRYKRYLDTSEK